MVIIMGLPGAGKTVQSELMQEKLGFRWLSTGKMLRESDDEEVHAIQRSGALVSDDLVIRVVENRLKKEGYDNTFLLDGFPRNTEQASWLHKHGDDIGKHIKVILFLDVDEEVAAERLGDRGREDDSEEARKKRQQEQKKLKPMLDYLESKDISVEMIDANRSIDEIFESIRTTLNAYMDLPPIEE